MKCIRVAGVALVLCFAMSMARAEDISTSATDVQRNIVSQKSWLNVSRPLTVKDIQGRIILLDFWTFACINCMHVIPDLQYLEKKFGSSLTVIGVHSAKFDHERDTENIRAAVLRYDIEHPVVNDFDFSIWRKFGVKAWPTFVLVGPGGNVLKTYAGEGHREELERDISGVLAKNPKIKTTPLPLRLEKGAALAKKLRFPGKLLYVPDFKGAPALIVADAGHNRIVVLSTDGTIQETIGGKQPGWKDGDFAAARFNSPQGMAWRDGALYVADTKNHLLRRVDFAGRRVTTLAGNGRQGFVREVKEKPALETPLSSPWDVEFLGNTPALMLAMAGTHQLWGYDPKTRTVNVLAGNGTESIDDGGYPSNSLSQPSALSKRGERMWFLDAETSALRVYEQGKITTLIGTGLFDFGFKDGTRSDARMQHPLGLFADASGVYVADSFNHAIRRFDPLSGKITTLAGTGARGRDNGAFAQATFNEPGGIARAGSLLYVADTNNHVIRVLDLDAATVRTLEVRDKPPPVLPSAPLPPLPPPTSDSLPNLEIGEKSMAAEVAISVTLELAPGWKIHDSAGSYLALFEMQITGGIPVQNFSREVLRKRKFALPPLKKRVLYRLQGTLNYCPESGAGCRVKSVDMELKTQPVGETSINILLR